MSEKSSVVQAVHERSKDVPVCFVRELVRHAEPPPPGRTEFVVFHSKIHWRPHEQRLSLLIGVETWSSRALQDLLPEYSLRN